MGVNTTNEFVDLLRDLIRQETNRIDRVALARVIRINQDGTYDVYVEPDRKTEVHSIQSIVPFIKVDDSVYLYKVNNELLNSFIIKKIGQEQESYITKEEAIELIKRYAAASGQTTIIQGGGSGSGGGACYPVYLPDEETIYFSNVPPNDIE